MAEYIEREALIAEFEKEEQNDIEMYGCHIIECFQGERAIEITKSIPSADVVEVVRCKDCKRSGLYAFGIEDGGKVLACLETEEDGFISRAIRVDPFDFCSYGERRTDSGNL